VLEFSKPQFRGHAPSGISAVPMWILAFGIFVPNTPVRALLGAFMSAYNICAQPLDDMPAWVKTS